MYTNNPLWSDVVPIDIRNDEQIFKVNYSEKFLDIFGYYLAVKIKNESSQRVFDILTDAIMINPSNYSLWTHRRQLLKDLKLDFSQEFQLLKEVMESDPKVYQAWYHRQLIVDTIGDDYENELIFLKNMLDEDNKNYHAWQYKIWLFDRFELWSNYKELDNINVYINTDPYNNSAWNFRYTYLKKSNKLNPESCLQNSFINEELEYIFKLCSTYKDNESSWNYLQGICHFLDSNSLQKVFNFSQQTVQSLLLSDTTDEQHYNNSRKCRIAFSFHVHFYTNHTDQLDFSAVNESNSKLNNSNSSKDYKNTIVDHIDLLSTHIDCIRAGYWSFYKKLHYE